MKRILRAILVLVLAAGLVVTGCTTQALGVGKPAPDFILPDLEGRLVSLSSLKGSPVFLNFWATWCRPCRYEMPFIQEIYEDEAWQEKGLVIVAVDLGESLDLVEDFMESFGLSFLVLLDFNKDLSPKYNIRGIPTTFLIDRDGIIQKIQVGAFIDKAAIEESLGTIIP